MNKKYIYYYKEQDVERLGKTIELGRCYGYSDISNDECICIENPSEEMLRNIQNYIVSNGSLVFKQKIDEPTFEEVQNDFNIDVDYRLSCIELEK